MRLHNSPTLWSKLSADTKIAYLDRQVRTDFALTPGLRAEWKRLMEDFESRIAAGRPVDLTAHRMSELLRSGGSPLADLVPDRFGGCLAPLVFDRITGDSNNKEAYAGSDEDGRRKTLTRGLEVD